MSYIAALNIECSTCGRGLDSAAISYIGNAHKDALYDNWSAGNRSRKDLGGLGLEQHLDVVAAGTASDQGGEISDLDSWAAEDNLKHGDDSRERERRNEAAAILQRTSRERQLEEQLWRMQQQRQQREADLLQQLEEAEENCSLLRRMAEGRHNELRPRRRESLQEDDDSPVFKKCRS
jgi:hypothetical protein